MKIFTPFMTAAERAQLTDPVTPQEIRKRRIVGGIWAMIWSFPILSLADDVVRATGAPWLALLLFGIYVGLYLYVILRGFGSRLPFPPLRDQIALWAFAALGVILALFYTGDGAKGGSLILILYVAVAGVALYPPRVAYFWIGGSSLVLGALGLLAGDDLSDIASIVLNALLATAMVLVIRNMVKLIRELDKTRTELAHSAVEQERLRFARDLHDLLGHTLSVIVVKAEVVRRLAERDPPAAAREAAEIEQVGRKALAEVREAVSGYRERAFAEETAQRPGRPHRRRDRDDAAAHGPRERLAARRGSGLRLGGTRSSHQRDQAQRCAYMPDHAGGERDWMVADGAGRRRWPRTGRDRGQRAAGPAGAAGGAGRGAGRLGTGVHAAREHPHRTEGARMIRVLLAEDQGMMRGALALLLGLEPDIEVVAQVERGDLVVEAVRENRPDVALLDIEMPGRSGLDAAADLRVQAPDCKVMILTTFGRPGYLRRAMEAGARGFLVKDGPVEELASAIRKVLAGQIVVDPALATAALSAGPNPLTDREREVLSAAVDGATIAEIAGRLHLSESTVRNYLSAAIGKTGSRNRMEAVQAARAQGWL